MTGKGTITIKTAKEDNKVTISILDDGEGIKKKNLKNFSTPDTRQEESG